MSVPKRRLTFGDLKTLGQRVGDLEARVTGLTTIVREKADKPRFATGGIITGDSTFAELFGLSTNPVAITRADTAASVARLVIDTFELQYPEGSAGATQFIADLKVHQKLEAEAAAQSRLFGATDASPILDNVTPIFQGGDAA